MKRVRQSSVLPLFVAMGLAGSMISAAHGQAVINVTGSTLLENFLKAPASTNDYLDVDGNGVARIFGTTQQLAPAGIPPASVPTNWVVQVRGNGSLFGLQDLVNFGSTFATGGDTGSLLASNCTYAYANGTKFINNGVSFNAIYNPSNPGGAPVRSDESSLQFTYAISPLPATGGIRMDVAALDVPTLWGAQNITGTPSYQRIPAQAGYGTNPRVSVNTHGGLSNANQTNKLAVLGTRNLFDPHNPTTADANTLFDTNIAVVPIAIVTNLGTGLRQITQTQLQHLNVTGRLPTGENLTMVTRDSGSGTRNGFCNVLGFDPSFGVGENIGVLSTGNANLIGPDYAPSNKNGSGDMEAVVINTRLGIGYSGAERGVNNTWLTGGKMEILGVKMDQLGATSYVRPTINALLDNDINGYIVAGSETFVTLGDPLAAPAGQGGLGEAAGTPSMLNPAAAAYVNNITASIDAFETAPGSDATLFTPGEFLATNFLLTAAVSNIHDPAHPTSLLPNMLLNPALQTFVRGFSVFNNPAYATFGTVTLNGLVPTREPLVAPATYSDHVGGGQNYIDQAGNIIGYGTALSTRNRIAGDFNGDGKRDLNDAADMVAAWKQRNGGAVWTAPDYTGANATGTTSGSAAVIEILGDFNGDGNFDAKDVRYWADGLAMDPVSGKLDRKAGFTAVDTAFGGNFFGTTLATGKTYAAGDSRGDVAGGAGLTVGFAPIGNDGVIDAKDIDYVFAQFAAGRNVYVTTGVADWTNLGQAQGVDLSCDINGDLKVDQNDIIDLVENVLGTHIGDVNLDGVVDATDLQIAQAHLGQAGGWASGDVDGDGMVTSADIAIIQAAIGSHACNPADIVSVGQNPPPDGLLTGDDYVAFINAFFTGSLLADIVSVGQQPPADGLLTGDDYVAFINNFFVGCH